MLQNAIMKSSADCCRPRDDAFRPMLHSVGMAKERERNHLQAWREHNRLTQQQLADKVGTTAGVISLLEAGERGLSAKWLRRLAPHLNTTPGYLLDHHPDDIPSEMLRVFSDIDPDQREQALRVLRTFRRHA